MQWIKVALVLVLAVSSWACALQEPWGALVVNRTNDRLEVVGVGDAIQEFDYGGVAPGFTLPLHPYFGVNDSSCSKGTLVARRGDKNGPEVARRTEPLCYRDSWVIAAPDSTGSP